MEFNDLPKQFRGLTGKFEGWTSPSGEKRITPAEPLKGETNNSRSLEKFNKNNLLHVQAITKGHPAFEDLAMHPGGYISYIKRDMPSELADTGAPEKKLKKSPAKKAVAPKVDPKLTVEQNVVASRNAALAANEARMKAARERLKNNKSK
jgi:hypothetical protein